MASRRSLTATLSDPARLAALHAALLLDSAAEPEFDRLTRLAQRLLAVPTALISLVDDRRQFFKSCIGLNGWPAEQRGTPLSHSFCQHVVHSGEPLAIADARVDALLRTNLATTELDVVAYLGVPLRSRDGHVLGTLCAVDTVVRAWTDEDVAAMSDLAEGVMTEIVLGEEVRALRAAEQALADAAASAVAAAEAKARFLACMSHELRTPLNGILGILDLLDEGAQPDLLRVARSSGAELLRIVNDVLDFSKLEAGKLRLDPHPFALGELVHDTCDLLAGDAHAKDLRLVAHVDPRLPQTVHGDGGRLRQVLTNLVANAVKFTAAGEVVVLARPADDGIHFSVSDSGVGIAPDRLPELFNPFEQADVSTTRHHGGTGLGLTITRDLVELLGGTLHAESEPGRGSTFAFTIPLPAVAPAPANFDGATVLVADDSEINRRVITAMLSKRGVVAETVADGAQAVEAVRSGAFVAVLMDCEMPVADGFQATATLRAAGHRLPIIAMTGHVLDEDRRRCRQAGMDDHLAKPIEPHALDAVLQRWLR